MEKKKLLHFSDKTVFDNTEQVFWRPGTGSEFHSLLAKAGVNEFYVKTLQATCSSVPDLSGSGAALQLSFAG